MALYTKSLFAIVAPATLFTAHYHSEKISNFLDGQMERQKDGYLVRGQFLNSEIKRAHQRLEERYYFKRKRPIKGIRRDNDPYFDIQLNQTDHTVYDDHQNLLDKEIKNLKKN